MLFFCRSRCRRLCCCLSSLFYYVETGARLLVSLVGASRWWLPYKRGCNFHSHRKKDRKKETHIVLRNCRKVSQKYAKKCFQNLEINIFSHGCWLDVWFWNRSSLTGLRNTDFFYECNPNGLNWHSFVVTRKKTTRRLPLFLLLVKHIHIWS